MNKLLLIIIVLLFASCSKEEQSKQIYYVNSETGSDTNNGMTPETAWKSFDRITKIELKPGAQILLASGSVFNGGLVLEDVSGTSDALVEISMYKYSENTNLPVIDAKGFANGITLLNCSNVVVSDLEITGNGGGVIQAGNSGQNMHCGVLVTTTTEGVYENIQLKNLKIRDVFFEDAGYKRGKDEVRTANGTQSYGWGIRVINQLEKAEIKSIVIENCEVSNVAHTGIKLTGRNQNISEVKLYSNRVLFSGGPGMQMSGVKNAHIQKNYIDHSGSNNDSRKWGRGSGLWTWGCSDVLIEHNSFRNANGPGDSAGCHIDFNCKNVVVQYCFSENNAGGFCEILGNNYNCAYRYNISVNDGHRVKGENGAFQEGKIFWLSGYNGDKPRKGPFNSYFYNNTIYVNKDIVAKIAVDRASSGVLIANNIFCIEGESRAVQGDQYKPETEGQSQVENIVFKNNLYLKKENWPVDVLIQDEGQIVGDPQFKNPGGLNKEDYIPGNIDLIKDKGIKVEPIPGDSIGLTIGLDVEYDYFGNKIEGLPDLGAIQCK
ncbi:right-handed parallel beta-helix repeat-containing protein [Maribellus sediminis]|uniref:right-handed parallel beta-helix repeat-containing protein n=1 Tax=Maribellus sediminis TaxID=2696285 RepID=UPI0014319055|nr:right-handed parallel beta-helix repeat-containing protein [Maribellus sediminis]